MPADADCCKIDNELRWKIENWKATMFAVQCLCSTAPKIGRGVELQSVVLNQVLKISGLWLKNLQLTQGQP